MSVAQDNPEPPPAVCPACGYDMQGALGTVCPECGVDAVEEQARRGAGRCAMRSASEVLVPLALGTSIWLAVILLVGVQILIGSELGLQVRDLLIPLCIFLIYLLPLWFTIVYRREFSGLSRAAQDFFIRFAWIGFAAQFLLSCCLLGK